MERAIAVSVQRQIRPAEMSWDGMRGDGQPERVGSGWRSERALGRLAAPPGKRGLEPPPRRYAAARTPVFNFAPRRQT